LPYPRITADLDKMVENVALVKEKCAAYGIDIIGVTKGFCAHPDVASAYVKGGVSGLGDSRIDNLKKLQHLNVPKYLLRIPMLSEVESVIEHAHISFNSELVTIKALGKEALRRGKIHRIILMVELGDIREGVLEQDVTEYIQEIKGIEGIEFSGIGANLSCFGGVIPDEHNMSRLVDLADRIEKETGVMVGIVSGGSTSSIPLVSRGKMPKKINHLRLGEIFIIGTYGPTGIHTDVFKMEAEIIEIKSKPSVPTGETGLDAFLRKPVFEDKGIRKRALLAIGRQDVDIEHIKPSDQEIEIIGASSDHLILDIDSCAREYRVGDIVEFGLNYVSILRLMTSEYVHKFTVTT